MNSSEILIGKWGKINAGEHAGWFVLVEDDAAKTGGFFIYRSPQASLDSCFDDWVETRDGVDKFFHFAGWQTQWPDTAA